MCEKKLCAKCGEEKELDKMVRSFNILKDGTRSYFYRSTCKRCDNKAKDARRKVRGYSGNSQRITRMRERSNNWSKKNLEARKIISRKHTLRKYGLTLEGYDNLLKEQNECCKICGTHYLQVTRQLLDVDHCHTTGKVRGLLCTDCNGGLGKFKDNIILMQEAIKYLEENKFDKF